MAVIDPEPGYFVRLVMTMTSKSPNTPLWVRVFLPLENDRQLLRKETFRDAGFNRDIDNQGGNRLCGFRGVNLTGPQTISYSFLAQTGAKKFHLPGGEVLPATGDHEFAKYLLPEQGIEADQPEIVNKARALVGGATRTSEVVQKLFDFVASGIEYRNFKGTTSALTALRLGQASCNGKNRLLIALCRSLHLPARIVGGLVLKPARGEQSITKKTTHSWTEIHIGGNWVPFCATNGYYAEIPSHYLELYKGDETLISHLANINFDYRWRVTERTSSRDEVLFVNASNPFNFLHLWATLKEAHISLNLLVIILTVPIGATLVAFARNVIGLVPFGTFMPALIAVAFRDTGLLWGMALFTLVIITAGIFWSYCEWAGILHVPRLAALLTFEVLLIVGLALLAMRLGYKPAAAISLFPMAILTLTTERFALSIIEEGMRETLQRFVVSLLLAALCYGVMRSVWVENLVIAYPEILLSVIGLNILLGMWTGMRLTELFRFRSLYFGKEALSEGSAS
jgi:transglutaminase-like putative cysteine protease